MEPISIEDWRRALWWRTLMLVVTLIVLAIAVGLLVGYGTGDRVFGIIVTIGFILYELVLMWFSVPLTMMATGARYVSPEESLEAKVLHDVVEEISLAAGIPKPKVGIIESPEPNAYAAGLSPSGSVVVVTRGLLEMMNREELTGVIAHEIGHIKNRDVVISIVAAAFAFGFMVLLRWLLRWGIWFGGGRRRRDGESGLSLLVMILGLVVAVVAALLIRLAISRQREYLADATSAWLTRDPEALASALEKIAGYYSSGAPSRLATAPEEMSHLFIEEPPRKSFWAGLFATHPPIEDRIQRLRRMTVY